MTTFLFDVDGTLTDARKPINVEFEYFMKDFIMRGNKCMIVTGSDREKTVEQIGLGLTLRFARVYHCSGNHVFDCLLYTSPSPRDGLLSRMPSSA